MIVAGIVAEYNPFHHGHAYQLEQTKLAGATHTVAVMSGNFVQRGEPALALKHARAKVALANGVDLVIELPVPWASSAAMTFAKGAVSLLEALGFVDLLSFGSESGDTALLKSAAAAVASKQLNNGAINAYTAKGISFAAAREAAVRELFGHSVADVLKNSNDILAVEYIRVLNELKSGMEPFAIKRVGADHDQIGLEHTFASASQIRKSIAAQEDYEVLLPPASLCVLKEEIAAGRAPASYSRLETAVVAAMRIMDVTDIAKAPDISEGIENRIAQAVQKATTLEQVFRFAKTKRYSHARIRRIVLQSFLGIKAQDCEEAPPYIRVLAVNGKGRELLRRARQTATLPVVMKAADVAKLDERAKRVFALECRAADVFALALPIPGLCGNEQKANIILD
ncbi:MAG TPA: nucleotidyltransferase family protein [Clostridia bacterium]|nr:nucleotidyltransferase family protein [Clostridia bacterium]